MDRQRRTWLPPVSHASDHTCAVCGALVGATWLVAADGRVMCPRHKNAPACVWCGFPASFAMDEYLYCHSCRGRAVVSAKQVARLGNLLRASLLQRRCWLPEQVPLRIESKSDLVRAGHFDIHMQGWTVATFAGRRLTGQVISVRHGLPEEVCLFTLAHEYGHVMLNHHEVAELPALWVEGFCQFLAGAVLLEQLPASRPAAQRYQEEISRGGIYGRGMRVVTEAAQRHGDTAVIRAFTAGRPDSLELPEE